MPPDLPMVTDAEDYPDEDDSNNNNNGTDDNAPGIFNPPEDPLPELLGIDNSNDEVEENNNNDRDLFQNENDSNNVDNLASQDDNTKEEDGMGHRGTNLPKTDQRRYPLQKKKKREASWLISRVESITNQMG
jgi:hypothetical protein